MGLYEVDDDNTTQVLWLRGHKLLEKYYENIGINLDTILRMPVVSDSVDQLPAVDRIAVVGGGVSGLHVAMRLGKKYKVDVFEAAERVGGRLFTYKFNGGAEWDYFDVGAMRFPHTNVMKTTYRLFEELQLPLLPYEMSDSESWLYYNKIRVRRGDAAKEDFGARVSEKGNVPDKWVEIGTERLMDIVCKRFLTALKKDPVTGLEKLMKWDDHSTRSFMAFVELPEETDPDTGEKYPAKEKFPTVVINWLETMTFSVGWFDRAFTETVLESYAFAQGASDTQWRCVKHGSERITDAMKAKLESDPVYKENVTIKLLHQTTSVVYNPNSGDAPMSVSGEQRQNPNTPEFTPFDHSGYSHVVLAVSPQVMRYIDLSTCKLDYTQRSALLMLQPGPSTKVGVKFKHNWWKDQGIHGGQSQTDLPVRTIVYPSYGNGESTVIIASYCWTQDAATMAALMQGPGSFDENRLKKEILHDLAEVHGLSLEFLESEYDGIFPFDWAHNPKTMGAYAFFGPGDFTSLYGSLTRPAADLRLHFGGEAISTCHAWVAGALESANRVVTQINPDLSPDDPTMERGVPHGDEVQNYPTLLGKRALLGQLAVSSYMQSKKN